MPDRIGYASKAPLSSFPLPPPQSLLFHFLLITFAVFFLFKCNCMYAICHLNNFFIFLHQLQKTCIIFFSFPIFSNFCHLHTFLVNSLLLLFPLTLIATLSVLLLLLLVSHSLVYAVFCNSPVKPDTCYHFFSFLFICIMLIFFLPLVAPPPLFFSCLPFGTRPHSKKHLIRNELSNNSFLYKLFL